MGDVSAAGEHLVIPTDRVPIAAYQAIYHKLTSKVEKLSEVFPDAYRISKEDIIQLNHRFEQAIVQYPVQSKNATCGVSFHKHEAMRPSSFEKFVNFNFSTSKPTSKVVYQFDFFTVLPVEIKEAENIVQRFKVEIIIDQDFVEEDDGVPYFFRGVNSGNNITVVVEYSDYNVGRNLQVVVQDWVSTLEKKKIPEWMKFLDRGSDFISSMVPRAFLAASLFGLSAWFSGEKVNNTADALLIAFGIATLSYMLGHVLSVEIYRRLMEARPLTFICITKGDLDRSKRMCSRQERRAYFVIFLFGTIICGILVNLFSSYIYERFFP